MILFLEFFILQRFMIITLEIAMQVHEAGIEFMEAAKRVFPERNGARNHLTLWMVGKGQYTRS